MFKCGVCDKVFTTKSNMFRHNRSHNNKKFTCIECQQMFSRRDGLVNHIQKKHGFIKHNAEYNMGIAVEQQSLSSGVVDCVASSSNANVIIPPQAPTPHTSSVKRTKTNSAQRQFLTKLTFDGLKITIQSTIDLIEYLLEECGFSYVLTAKFNQDSLKIFCEETS
ncbi:hypothetical protein QTP88_027067 [Uroleucon formosanum]